MTTETAPAGPKADRGVDVAVARPPLSGRPGQPPATRSRLIGERVAPETADAWIAEWEAQAAEDGLERGAAYWDAGWGWIAEQRRRALSRPG